ncbi:DEAD/DEAH box helicase [Jiella endophytica]|uniref:DEAD-box ATP-dependent RNA helicase RhpA n=1 Tax=Jiella endophytica TaxID=2558362 RepID=A0A4Y8RGY9_9HYPH|nr:DEAD/DEAH box helicase [Jiella endophytica]TFF21686.1 DEAD/DEAH box helicase [Jiella endophytica]
MTSQNFQAFGLADTLTAALARLSITEPTPIQAQAIPAVMAGRDVLGIAQTGTGKTAAFSLPVIHALLQKGGRPAPRQTKVLILTPTRELASQIAENVKSYTAGTKITHTVVFGGVSIRPQITTLARGVDIVIATPGRLLDLMNQRAVELSGVEHVVLDEADRMLDMGFVRDVMKIVAKLPAERQSLLFSATMPKSIEDLAAKILTKPVRVEVTPEVVTVEKIDQSVYLVPQKAKKHWLIDRLADASLAKVVIFTRTKHGANRLAGDLEKAGIPALAIHGNKSQAARQKALAAFQKGSARVLVATDIVARGIHVDNITHVVNFELPEEPESYVHRIGRTARAGQSGAAIALIDPSERSKLKAIARLTRQTLEPQPTDFKVPEGAMNESDERPARGPRQPRGRNGNGQQRRGNPGQGAPRNAKGGENRRQDGAGQQRQGPRRRRRGGGGGGQRQGVAGA